MFGKVSNPLGGGQCGRVRRRAWAFGTDGDCIFGREPRKRHALESVLGGHGGPGPVLPANCPFTPSAVPQPCQRTAVFSGTQNANGSWGGVNATGTAVFSQGGTTLYTGFLHFWVAMATTAASARRILHPQRKASAASRSTTAGQVPLAVSPSTLTGTRPRTTST